MVMDFALIGAPITDIGAKPAILFVEPASRHHELDTDQTGIDTLQATVGTIISTFLACHLYRTVLAIQKTQLASFDTLFIIGEHLSKFLIRFP